MRSGVGPKAPNACEAVLVRWVGHARTFQLLLRLLVVHAGVSEPRPGRGGGPAARTQAGASAPFLNIGSRRQSITMDPSWPRFLEAPHLYATPFPAPLPYRRHGDAAAMCKEDLCS
jgi:hypothetical protein